MSGRGSDHADAVQSYCRRDRMVSGCSQLSDAIDGCCGEFPRDGERDYATRARQRRGHRFDLNRGGDYRPVPVERRCPAGNARCRRFGVERGLASDRLMAELVTQLTKTLDAYSTLLRQLHARVAVLERADSGAMLQ